MGPAEKLQKEIDDKRLQVERSRNDTDRLESELEFLVKLQQRLFARPTRAARSDDGKSRKELAALFEKTMEEAPDLGVTVKSLAETMSLSQTAIFQRLQRGMKLGTVQRVGDGRYRGKVAKLEQV